MNGKRAYAATVRILEEERERRTEKRRSEVVGK
jgi:hypothetical protein